MISWTFRSMQRMAFDCLPLRRGNNRRIADSGLFDRSWYLQQYPEVRRTGYDPIVHFLRKGARGYNPNPYFQTMHYLQRNPDLLRMRRNPLIHYIEAGHRSQDPGPLFDVASYAEANHVGRDVALAHFLAARRACPSLAPFPIDPQREAVMIVSHDATRTGAPVIALALVAALKREGYQVLAVLLGGGGLEDDFRRLADYVVGPLLPADLAASDFEAILTMACEWFGPSLRFAVVNSVESRAVLPTLARRYIPTISLVHEFVSASPTPSAGLECARWSNQVVFPAGIVLDDARSHLGDIGPVRFTVCAPGHSPMPASHDPGAVAHLESVVSRLCRIKQSRRLVLGAGTLEHRKGIDLFLQCAHALRSGGGNPAYFAWLGGPATGPCAASLRGEINRMALHDDAAIDGAVSQLDAVYEITDIFFMSSRRDPLPNVALDAMRKGIPVVCFDGAGGIAELMRTMPAAAQCVAPYQDTAAAARVIARLAGEPAFHRAVGEEVRKIVERQSDTARHVETIKTLAAAAREACEAERRDAAIIEADPTFDPQIYLPPGAAVSRNQAIRDFVRSWASGTLQRRPCAGFQPYVFAAHQGAPSCTRAAVPTLDLDRNPLAEFIRQGRPPGPWSLDLLTIDGAISDAPPPGVCALHVHAFYPALMDDMLARLSGARTPCDILISTDTPDKAGQIERLVAAAGRRALIRVFPNRGRDLGPFLLGFRAELERYEIVGHVHTKATEWIGDAVIGTTWRRFLLDHLIGMDGGVMDSILATLRREPRLGLVFPSDPNLVGWHGNAAQAKALAAAMNMATDLPPWLDFPVGTMFWARRAALVPLLDLLHDWQGLPEEPLPPDGSLLHAIERMLPLVVEHTGYRCKVTHVPGATR